MTGADDTAAGGRTNPSGCPAGRRRFAGADRGVSHVLGVILVIAIVLAGIISIVGLGLTGISDSTSQVSDTAVERDLMRLAEAVDSAAVHSNSAAGTTTVDLSLTGVAESREWVTVDEDAGRLSLAIRSNGTERELLNTSLGLVEYNSPRSESRIAYQSGLVFSATDGTATPGVVRDNEFNHRTSGSVESLTLHVVRVTGQVLVDRELRVSPGSTENRNQGVVVGADSGTPADELVLRIDSAYSAGWEVALRESLPSGTTFDRNGPELEVVREVPEKGLFLHAYRHEVILGGQ